MKVIIGQEIKNVCPNTRIALLRADVVNSETDEMLWTEIRQMEDRIRDSYEMAWINKRPAIAATRSLYKHFGKDPNRYRVSSEALCRRIVKGMDVYRINTLVDLINLVSIGSGYAIGGFDADKIVGDTITWGVGEVNEKFEGIGRVTAFGSLGRALTGSRKNSSISISPQAIMEEICSAPPRAPGYRQRTGSPQASCTTLPVTPVATSSFSDKMRR